MQRRGLIFLVLAVVFALGTVYIARVWLSKEHAQFAHAKTEKPGIFVLVAARDLPTGSFIRAQDLRWQAWPKGQVAANYIRRKGRRRHTFEGSVVRSRIAAGQPVTANRLVKPGDRGFLAAVLKPGMRAVSVPVNPISDVSGLVFPGDHVDLILENRIKNARDPNAPAHVAGETVLRNLRVIAVGQSTNDEDKKKPTLAKTVTFEVTPKQAEIVEVASSLGNLYLSLRSLANDGLPKPGRKRRVSYVWDSQVTPLIHRGVSGTGATVTILRGSGSREGISAIATSPGPKAGAVAASLKGALS